MFKVEGIKSLCYFIFFKDCPWNKTFTDILVNYVKYCSVDTVSFVYVDIPFISKSIFKTPVR